MDEVDEATLNRYRTVGIYIPLLTGTLSVIGSGSIIYSIWANRSKKLKDPQHRILGMMSICDVFYSINKALKFLTYPAGLGVPTFGNTVTCSMQGFFNQIGQVAASYNMVLSIYYYLSINWGMKKEEFAKVWEKVLHGIVLICHLSFAIIGVSIGLFNPRSMWCYIGPGPVECCFDPNIPCRFLDTFWYFIFAFALGWILLTFAVIVVTNTLICLFVRRQEKEMEKYRTRSVASEQLQEMEKKTSYARSVFVQSMFYGFFNAFVYARPRYLRLKKKNKHLGFKQLIKLVFVPSNDDSGTGPSSGKSKKDSNVFRSFLSSLGRKEAPVSESDPAVSETDGAREKAKPCSESKPMQGIGEDEERGKAGEGETTNGAVSPAENEEEKVEEGEEFLDNPSPPTLSVS